MSYNIEGNDYELILLLSLLALLIIFDFSPFLKLETLF